MSIEKPKIESVDKVLTPEVVFDHNFTMEVASQFVDELTKQLKNYALKSRVKIEIKKGHNRLNLVQELNVNFIGTHKEFSNFQQNMKTYVDKLK
ncbi:hypothetical protein KW791_00805 [Candidatus Parcubacteria bacterium]|nr:hypothetical protein [Candidatus Parcubacteria bacterium]